MKTCCPLLALALLALAPAPARAKTIVVNRADNTSTAPGQTNLVQALSLLADGDSIHFNLPGPGPFYLVTPPLLPDNGYPAITNSNVTLDGYTQPGAAPNTNPILSANNARLQIVLDSRAGGGHVEGIPGYSSGESAGLLIKGATNVTLRGLCFLGPGVGGGYDGDPATYAVSFALGADAGHIQGCWFGLDLDRHSVYRFQDAVTGFEGAPTQYINGTVLGVEKSAPDAATARGQFNIILGEYIPVILEGGNYRIAGNFFNVFPDGLSDYNVNGTDPYTLQAFIEIGRGSDNLVLGTDGDGRNDAEERNIFGGVTAADDGQLLEWYGGDRTNMVIAGNYFGVGVDGVTRFTNSMKVFGGFTSATTVRVGSDFDGVSDALEANLFSMNYPFRTLFASPVPPGPPNFAEVEPGARVSFRGNVLLGNNLPWFSYADGNDDRLATFTNCYAPYIDTNHIIPVLSTNSTQARLRGSCALGLAPYTNIVLDVYLADPEGWTNGQQFQLWELMYTDPVSGQLAYNGFAQGRTYLGSFVDNGPADLDPRPGHFEFDLSGLNADFTSLVTVTASYSADPPGTHNGRTHTSAFATPITLQPAPRLSLACAGGNLILSWPTNSGLFTIQATATLHSPAWTSLCPQPTSTQTGTQYQATVPISPASQFYRLAR